MIVPTNNSSGCSFRVMKTVVARNGVVSKCDLLYLLFLFSEDLCKEICTFQLLVYSEKVWSMTLPQDKFTRFLAGEHAHFNSFHGHYIWIWCDFINACQQDV